MHGSAVTGASVAEGAISKGSKFCTHGGKASIVI